MFFTDDQLTNVPNTGNSTGDAYTSQEKKLPVGLGTIARKTAAFPRIRLRYPVAIGNLKFSQLTLPNQLKEIRTINELKSILMRCKNSVQNR